MAKIKDMFAELVACGLLVILFLGIFTVSAAVASGLAVFLGGSWIAKIIGLVAGVLVGIMLYDDVKAKLM